MVRSLSFSNDGRTLFAGGCQNVAASWNVETGGLIAAIDLPLPDVYAKSLAYCQSSKMLAVGAAADYRNPEGNVIFLFDGTNGTGKPVAVLRGHRSTIQSVAFSPDGKLLASSSFREAIHLWDVTAIRKSAEKGRR
jgi:WD40 repeat protein